MRVLLKNKPILKGANTFQPWQYTVSECLGDFIAWCFLFAALEKKTYFHIGRMTAVCVVHGGVAPGFFSHRLFSQLCGTPSLPASLEEVSDVSFREKLLKVSLGKVQQ